MNLKKNLNHIIKNLIHITNEEHTTIRLYWKKQSIFSLAPINFQLVELSTLKIISLQIV